MEAKERVFLAIRREKADRIPRGEIVIEDVVIQSFLCCPRVAFEERWEFVRSLGLDIVCQRPFFPPQQADMALPKSVHASWGDLGDWTERTDRFVFIVLDGAFGWGIRLWGFQRFVVALFRGSSDLTAFINGVEALNLELARRARDLGAMAVLLSDDLAYQRGLMASPKLLRMYLLPSLARQVEALTNLGLPVFFHSDGNLNEILADLAGMNLAGWQGLEASAGMDLALIKQRYGANLCLWGNLDPSYLILPCHLEEIAEHIDSIVKAAGQSGGLIFGTSSGLFTGVRPENLRSVYETLDRAGLS